MTRLYVRSALSILQDGIIDLGEQDVRKITIGDVKHMIATHCEIPIEDMLDHHRLFWHGYLLDQDESPISDACVGVDPDEALQGDETELVLFLTEKNDAGDNADDNTSASELDSSFQSLGRLRSNSINKVKDEIAEIQETISKCVVM